MRVRWCGGGPPVGETQKRPFQLSFNSSLRVDFQRAPNFGDESEGISV